MRRFFTGAAAPRKSDGGGAPSLPWGHESAVAPWCGAPFEKQKVGPPRRRGPKIQARMRRFFTGAAAPRKSDGGGAPSLPWGHESAVAPWCGAPFEKQKVGPPRRRGPKIQARMRRFFTGAAAPRKSDGGGAPSLPWGARGALSRRAAAALEQHSFFGHRERWQRFSSG